jgi:peptidoglycan/xylan/chitin deacetylase (PgdA/CDA1 family)
MTIRLRNMAKRALAGVNGMLPARRENRVIYYHSVHPEAPESLRPELFRAQLEWLLEQGFRTVLMRDVPGLLRDAEAKSPWVAISFDDGYRDNFQVAVPILREFGCVATFFVVAGMVDEWVARRSQSGFMLYPDREMLTRKELAGLAAAGMEVGSHGLTHRLATDVERERHGAFGEELRASVELLSAASGKRVVSFSYPNGQRGAFSPATRAALHAAGLAVGATTIWGTVEAGVDVLELPRCGISCMDDLEEFKAKLVGRRDFLRLIHRVRRGSRVWQSREALGREDSP